MIVCGDRLTFSESGTHTNTVENNNLRNQTVPNGANGVTYRQNPAPTPLFADAAGLAPVPVQVAATPMASQQIAIPGAAAPPIPLAPPSGAPQTLTAGAPAKKARDWHKMVLPASVVAFLLLLVGGGAVVFNALQNKSQEQNSVSSQVANVSIPLSEFASSGSLALLGTQSLTVNGQLRANESFVLAPQAEPTKSERGQLYYDNGSNQLAYFNGSQFIKLPGAAVVQTFQGQTGDITLLSGNGISIVGSTFTNTGVTSLGGQTGDIGLGSGLQISAGTLQATGVQSLTSGSPANLSIADDGAGNLTITSFGAGTGTVQSPGGTNGRIAMFTGAQTIEDSLISQSGSTVTVTGNLTVTSGGLTLTTPLTVASGGTGAATLTTNGVIVGNGTSALSSVTAAGAGLCLMSTGGAPAFSACPGGGGVTSLDGLSGVLTLANSSGVGSTITIDDASNSAKGIAQFNGTNLSVSGGVVNTIQNIHSGASPTFAGINTSSITPSTTLTVGGNLNISTGSTYQINGVQISSAALSNDSNLAKLSATQTFTGATNTFKNAADSASAFSVQNTGSQNILGVNTSSGTVLLGEASALAGKLAFNNATNGNTITLQTAVASGPQVITFPDATGTVCLTTGNCAGAGGGIIGSGTADRMAKFTASGTIGNSTVSDDGTTVSTTVDVVVQGGDLTLGTGAAVQPATLVIYDGFGQKTTLQAGNSAGDLTFILPTTTGNTNQCLKQSGTGNQLVWQDCDGGSGGSSATLQSAYNNGRTISASSATGDIAFTLNDASFTTTIADGSSNFVAISRASGAGTSDPAQLLLLDNLDTDRAAPIGIKLQAAGGGMTTAIDATDVEIVDALNVAANNIKGTTGNIDFDNFDVIGSSGNITTAGDLAVNGGDITSSGALRIAPTSSLTAGTTGQTTTVQGTVTTLTSNGAGNDIILTSADTIELQGATNVTGALAVSGTITASTLGSTNTATYLCRNGSSQIAACNTTGAGAAFVQGGNLFGATATLGTNDGNALVLRTGSTTRMTLGSGGGVLIAKNDTADELEVGDDVFNLNDTASRISIANSSDNSFLRVGQSTTNYGYVGWAYNSLSSAAFMRLGTANDTNFLSLQADSTDGVTINGTTEPGTGIGLQLEGSNLASISSSNFVISSQNTLTLDIDSSANDTSSTFKVTRDDGAATLFTVDQNGTAILPGGQTADITSTTTSGTGSAITIQPASSTAGVGAVLNLKGGQTNASGNTAGAVAISGGNEVGTGSTTGGAVSINGGTGNTAGAVNIGNTSAGSINLGNTSSNIQTTINGLALVKSGSSNSASAFQVQSSTGADTLFSVDTTARSGSGGNLIKIGNSTGTDTNLTILQLDATTADPTTNLSALNGGLFYNSTTNKVSLIENGAVKIICNTTDLGCGTGTVTLQTAYTNSSSPEITVDGTRGAVTIQDAASPIGANLFEVQSNGGSTKYFAATAGGISTVGTASQTYSGTSDANTVTMTSTTGTQTNGVLVNRNGSGGTTTNGVNITQTAGTMTNGLAFTGTIGTDINRGSGTMTLQGNGGINLSSASGNITIGTSNTTGTLLVLDTKTDAGDPTGVDGAMYYNSALGVTRCFIDSYWRDCVENERTTYKYVNDFIKVPFSETFDDTLTVSGEWYPANDTTFLAGHPGILNLATSTNGAKTLLTSGDSFSNNFTLGNNVGWRYEVLGALPSLSDGTDRFTITTGFNNVTDTITSIDNGCYFRYSDNINSGKWQGVCEDGGSGGSGGTEAICDTTITAVAGTFYRLTLVMNSTATSADFRVNGVSKCTISTHIPSSTTLVSFISMNNKLAGNGIRGLYMDYLSVRALFDTAR